MALSLTEQHTISYDGLFIAKLRMALLAESEAIMVEDSDDAHNGTPVYVARMSFAQQVIGNPQGMAERAAQLAAVTAAHTDPDEMGDSAYVQMAKDVMLPLANYNPHYVVHEPEGQIIG